jgi:hypothetical protein
MARLARFLAAARGRCNNTCNTFWKNSTWKRASQSALGGMDVSSPSRIGRARAEKRRVVELGETYAIWPIAAVCAHIARCAFVNISSGVQYNRNSLLS